MNIAVISKGLQGSPLLTGLISLSFESRTGSSYASFSFSCSGIHHANSHHGRHCGGVPICSSFLPCQHWFLVFKFFLFIYYLLCVGMLVCSCHGIHVELGEPPMHSGLSLFTSDWTQATRLRGKRFYLLSLSLTHFVFWLGWDGCSIEF